MQCWKWDGIGQYGIPALLSDDHHKQKQFCGHQTRFLCSKYHIHAFAVGALARAPLGELTVLPQTL